MPLRLISLLAIYAFVAQPLFSQVVSIYPYFPKQTDTITVTYNAKLGNGALVGVSPVYAHTGLITDKSTSPSDWKYTQGNWGQPDPKVLMSDLGNDLHQISYYIPTFYTGLPTTDTVKQLAFVFRNADGSIVGRSSNGSDIYVPVFAPGFYTQIFTPSKKPALYEIGDTIHIFGGASESAMLTLYDGSNQLAQVSSDTLTYDLITSQAGKHWLILEADNGVDVVRDSVYYVVNPPVNYVDPPVWVEAGITYTSDTSAYLALWAPHKNFVYVIGDFTNWEVDPDYQMNVTLDSLLYWIHITGFTPGEEYGFQYLVDGNLQIADAYADKILDPWNDQYISNSTYPNLKDYPVGETQGIVSVLQTHQPPFAWNVTNFQKPEKRDLVIYELLIRDFLATHNYETLIDTLDYLENLGINCIELMPVSEFEGNISWGYNPDFFFAPDKYYGPKDDLKRFIDECHARGIAVVQDIVLNHAFGLCPLVQLYWDPVNNRPAANSPWFNPIPKHDFNVGYDFNHESNATDYFSKRVMWYWLEEYRFDGFRFDLSKGFTQKNTLGNTAAWGQYDAGRIAIWKDYADHIWSVDPSAYVILEHFADNSEEKELANYGMMIWGNLNNNYNQTTMGYVSSSDLSWGYYGSRGWNDPNLVTYMESHDEERLMFKNLQFGNSNGSYNIKNLNTALSRIEMAGTLFFTIPGPKMIWQFGELGYDVSIDQGGRTGPKPIRWNYFNVPARLKIYKVFRALINLKKNYEVFRSGTVSLSVGGLEKRIRLAHSSMNAVVIANMDVVAQDVDPAFHNMGWWYEYFTGDSINVTNVNDQIHLQPGEYRIYTTNRLPVPDTEVPIGIQKPETEGSGLAINLYPNPSSNLVWLDFTLKSGGTVTLELMDITGRVLSKQVNERPSGQQNLQLDIGKMVSTAGTYIVRVIAPDGTAVRTFMWQP